MSAPPGTEGTVPNVSGEELDQVEATLQAEGLGWQVYGGGTFGVVIASDWTVCSQSPSSGSQATTVNLVVARECS
jgi:beta-lactam-binding protein with PASTA domain